MTAPVCCRPNLGLPADVLRVSEAPGLRRRDHRTGERARSALPPRPGSVQSCDGHPRSARAGGRDGRTHGVGGGGDRRAAGPCAHIERRRPHDAEARHEPWCMLANDRLNHGVYRKASAETTNRAADALCESIDSPGRRHAQRATATVSIGTRLPALNLARARRESTRFRCPVHIGVRAMTLFRVPDWFFRCTDAQARPRRWIARREALRRSFVHVGERARILTCGCALFVGLDARWLPPRSPRHLVPPFSCWHCILRASALHRGRPRPAATA